MTWQAMYARPLEVACATLPVATVVDGTCADGYVDSACAMCDRPAW